MTPDRVSDPAVRVFRNFTLEQFVESFPRDIQTRVPTHYQTRQRPRGRVLRRFVAVTPAIDHQGAYY
jgi:hypothetical protein